MRSPVVGLRKATDPHRTCSTQTIRPNRQQLHNSRHATRGHSTTTSWGHRFATAESVWTHREQLHYTGRAAVWDSTFINDGVRPNQQLQSSVTSSFCALVRQTLSCKAWIWTLIRQRDVLENVHVRVRAPVKQFLSKRVPLCAKNNNINHVFIRLWLNSALI